jgi:hypothetical protein
MLKQYSVLSKCLAELKKSNLPVIEKLRIEVQLIQTKRILLDHVVENKISGLASSEYQFNNLYEQLRNVCGSEDVPEGMERLKELLLEIKEELNLVANGRSKYSLQKAQERKPAVRILGVKDLFHN